jgi:cell division protein FtsL
MAEPRRRVNSRSLKRQLRQVYEDGNAVREPVYEPEEERRQRAGHAEKRRRRVSRPVKKARTRAEARRLQRNRTRATYMSAGKVLFITVFGIIAVVICIYYLQLKSARTTQLTNIAAKESELSKIQADNDAYEKTVLASESLEEIRKTALKELGMKYPSEDQIRYYSTDDNSYVRQYTDVPKK